MFIHKYDEGFEYSHGCGNREAMINITEDITFLVGQYDSSFPHLWYFHQQHKANDYFGVDCFRGFRTPESASKYALKHLMKWFAKQEKEIVDYDKRTID